MRAVGVRALSHPVVGLLAVKTPAALGHGRLECRELCFDGADVAGNTTPIEGRGSQS